MFREARLTSASGVRRHFRPIIEDVDDRLPDLIQEWDLCQKNPLDKETFSDTALLNPTVSLTSDYRVVARPHRTRVPRASVARADLHLGLEMQNNPGGQCLRRQIGEHIAPDSSTISG